MSSRIVLYWSRICDDSYEVKHMIMADRGTKNMFELECIEDLLERGDELPEFLRGTPTVLMMSPDGNAEINEGPRAFQFVENCGKKNRKPPKNIQERKRNLMERQQNGDLSPPTPPMDYRASQLDKDKDMTDELEKMNELYTSQGRSTVDTKKPAKKSESMGMSSMGRGRGGLMGKSLR
jgi:hypothetical protein